MARRRRSAAFTTSARTESLAEVVFLKCEAFEGMFPNEVGVVLRLGDEQLTMFVEPEDIELEGVLGSGRYAEAWLSADVVRVQGDRVVVDLPRETMTCGSRIAVDRSLLLGRGAVDTV